MLENGQCKLSHLGDVFYVTDTGVVAPPGFAPTYSTAPEARGATPDYSPAMDIFSFGVLMLRFLHVKGAFGDARPDEPFDAFFARQQENIAARTLRFDKCPKKFVETALGCLEEKSKRIGLSGAHGDGLIEYLKNRKAKFLF